MCLHVYRIVPNTPPFDIHLRPIYGVAVNNRLGRRAVASIKKRGNCSAYDRKRCPGFGK